MLLVCIFIKDVMGSTSLYDEVSFKVSKLVSRTYNTSFSFVVSSLDKEMLKAIYNIYGFVRSVDETFETFPEYNKVLTPGIRVSESHKMALLAKALIFY